MEESYAKLLNKKISFNRKPSLIKLQETSGNITTLFGRCEGIQIYV